jgi:hypothetical protein
MRFFHAHANHPRSTFNQREAAWVTSKGAHNPQRAKKQHALITTPVLLQLRLRVPLLRMANAIQHGAEGAHLLLVTMHTE